MTVLTYNVVLCDIPERKRAENRQRFLSDAAGQMSATSLDYGTTMTAVARLAVPALPDCCMVDKDLLGVKRIESDGMAMDQRAVPVTDLVAHAARCCSR